MDRTARTAVWTVALTLGMAAAQSTESGAIERQDVTLGFGDFQSAGQWTYPAGGASSLPAVILIAGSTPADMDFTVSSPDGTVKSHIFLDLANYLSARGVAVLRYNKHYVTGPGKGDFAAYYTKANLHTFLADASSALSSAEHNPRVDPKRLFVYGWSEGSTVAAALATVRPEVAGLIVQGPVVQPWRESFAAQFNDVQLPFLRQMAPGGVTDQNFAALANSSLGGGVAKSVLSYIGDPQAYQQGEMQISPALDANKDGALELDSEVVPGFSQILDTAFAPQGFFSIYSPRNALPSVSQDVANLSQPLLVLQGENDANTPAQHLDLLRQALSAAGKDATIKVYPGLGHSLGPASSIVADDFAPIASQPMQDTLDWILAH